MTETSPAPEPPAALPDAPTREADARRYARTRRLLLLAHLAIVTAGLVLLLLFGLHFALRDALAFASWEPLARWQPLRVLLFFVALFVAQALIDLPFSWLGGYRLPHRYGLSTQRARAWALDELKGFVLGLAFEGALIVGLYALLATSPTLWWLWAGLLLVVVTVLLVQLTPVLLLPLFNKLIPLPDGEVRRRALALAARAKTPVREVFSIDLSRRTTAANAAVIGLGRTRRIIIGDTLLSQFTPDEIEVVVAHELGHQVRHDIVLLIVSQSIIMLAALFVAHLALDWAVATLPGYHGLADPATLALLVIVLGLAGLVTLPLVNGLSRRVEQRADGYALSLTHDAPAFISAMHRLADQNLDDATPSPWVEFFLLDHPSTGRRIAYGKRWATEHPGEASEPA
ncbi:MAG TPA: M48 family metalloprotease [Ktedonobacterales bacterium]